MTLVPGAGMYRIVYYILNSQNETSMYYLLQTLQTAAMIALAIFVVNIVLGGVFRWGRDTRLHRQ